MRFLGASGWFAGLALVWGACTNLAGLGDLEFEAATTTTGAAGSDGGQGGSGASGGAGGSGGAGCPEDLTSDPEHCGACDHSCLGGACENGQCQPVLIADGQSSPLHVVANDESIYWTSYVTSGGIRRMNRETRQIAQILNGLDRPAYLALTATHLYWTEHTGDVVMRSDLDGNDPQVLAQTPEVDQAFGVAVQRTTLFWVNGGGGGGIQQLSIGFSGPPTEIFGSLSLPEGLWLHDGDLYVAEENGGTVYRWPPGGPAEIVADGLSDPVGVAADDDYVYITDQAAGQLLRVAQPSGDAEVIHEDDDQNGGVAVTDDAIFWTSLTGDRVMMLAK